MQAAPPDLFRFLHARFAKLVLVVAFLVVRTRPRATCACSGAVPTSFRGAGRARGGGGGIRTQDQAQAQHDNRLPRHVMLVRTIVSPGLIRMPCFHGSRLDGREEVSVRRFSYSTYLMSSRQVPSLSNTGSVGASR